MPLPALLSDAEQAESLRSELRQLDHQWQAHSDGDAAFADQLREASLDEVREQRLRLKETMRVRDEERARELASAETLRQKLKARADETRPLELGQQVESLRARLGDAIDEWAPLTLARHLMEQARQRFEKNQQPQLLIDAGEIFSQLTLGEYVQLTRAIGKETELLAVPRVGTAKLPKEMSTGNARAALPGDSAGLSETIFPAGRTVAARDGRRAGQFRRRSSPADLAGAVRFLREVPDPVPDLPPPDGRAGADDQARSEAIELKPAVWNARNRSRKWPKRPPKPSEILEIARGKPDEPEHPVLFR